MAKLPRHRARHLAPTLGLALAALGGAGGARAEAESTLMGTWHVIVHYTDANTSRPDATRWDDRVWVFEPAGSELRWTEYPLVVFSDKSGRFEHLGTSAARRVIGPWEPNEVQRAQLRSGVEVNPRGSRSKRLRGSDERGWRTAARARPGSASVISYVENWSIEGLPGRPVFRREDSLGSARSETLEGVTLYATTEVRRGGRELRGRFDRDGTRRGTFRMTRAGAVRDVEGSGRSPGERTRELFSAELESEPDAVAAEIEAEIEEGRSLEEIGQKIREGEIGR